MDQTRGLAVPSIVGGGSGISRPYHPDCPYCKGLVHLSTAPGSAPHFVDEFALTSKTMDGYRLGLVFHGSDPDVPVHNLMLALRLVTNVDPPVLGIRSLYVKRSLRRVYHPFSFLVGSIDEESRKSLEPSIRPMIRIGSYVVFADRIEPRNFVERAFRGKTRIKFPVAHIIEACSAFRA